MKNKKLWWTLAVLAILGAVIAGALLHTVWPFKYFPVAEIQIQRQAPAVQREVEQLEAGVAIRDITGPIGIPKMGYSAWALQADGFRNRLKARVFYLKAPQSPAAAIIQVDLGAGSLVLHHAVAEKVAQATDLGFGQITILPTHTHSAPGNFLGSNFYNAFGGNKPGFDPKLFAFLVAQISDAVIEAYQTRRPAKIGIGSREVYGAAKNRSMGAYIRNPNVTDKDTSEAAALKAVNPLMTMVRVDLQTDEGDYKPAGAFTSFSIHGTGIPAFTAPYHADVWAYFQREVEWRVEAFYNPPWQPAHATFQATHGDNNPAYRNGLRGEMETRRIGTELGEAAWELMRSLNDDMRSEVSMDIAMQEINLLTGNPTPLCNRAIVGTAVVGAAQGDEIFPIAYLPPFQEGWPRAVFTDGCHAEKRWMLSKLQSGIDPEHYPHRLLMHSIRIDDLLMVGVPFEVTFQSGRRIAEAVQAQLTNAAPELNHITINSLANGFFGYSTTREEYSAQWYEGGHTIYGPGTTDFLSQRAADLVARMFRQSDPAPIEDLPEAWQFELRQQQFFPEEVAASGQRASLSEPVFHASSPSSEPYWSWQYMDVGPAHIDLHLPLLTIQTRRDGNAWQAMKQDGLAVTDEGYDLQIRHLENLDQGMARYELRWFHPKPASADQQYRFKVRDRQQLGEFYSPAFR